MTVKECLFKAHHGVHISDDDEEFLKEMRELGGQPFRLRATDTFTVSKQDFLSYERSLDYIPDYDKPLPNARKAEGVPTTAASLTPCGNMPFTDTIRKSKAALLHATKRNTYRT